LDEAVLASLDQATEPLEGVVDVREARIQRRQAETDRVGAAEVGEYVAVYRLPLLQPTWQIRPLEELGR
jgi:hypothetical protein